MRGERLRLRILEITANPHTSDAITWGPKHRLGRTGAACRECRSAVLARVRENLIYLSIGGIHRGGRSDGEAPVMIYNST